MYNIFGVNVLSYEYVEATVVVVPFPFNFSSITELLLTVEVLITSLKTTCNFASYGISKAHGKGFVFCT